MKGSTTKIKILHSKLQYMQLNYKTSLLGFVTICSLSCEKFIEVNPPTTALVGETVYSSSASASAAISGIYIDMVTNYTVGGGGTGMSALLALSADELKNFGNDPIQSQAYTNALFSTNPAYFWSHLYNYIYQANTAIEGLEHSSAVSVKRKLQLIGEAKFIRAFCYFYLINIYGDVPLATSTDYRINTNASRTEKKIIYQQIINDLVDAHSNLDENYLDAAGEITLDRVRPNRGAASALLARVYLYVDDWSNAEAKASELITNQTTYDTVSLPDVFKINSNEAIWQLQLVSSVSNTMDGFTFIYWIGYPPPAFGINPFSISSHLINSFEPGDKRKANWIGSLINGSDIYYYPFKYKVATGGTSYTEFPTILRLGEQYLIRAEARAQLNKLQDAVNDLNTIRLRAGLSGLPTSLTKDQVLSAVEHERQVELFTEYGHRWFDIIRTNRIDEIMEKITTQKGGIWTSTAKLFPIPLAEIQANSNLSQNPGYQ